MVAGVGNEAEDEKIEKGKRAYQGDKLSYFGKSVRSGKLFFQMVIGEDADSFFAFEEKKAQKNKDQTYHKERTQDQINDKAEIGIFHNTHDVEDSRNQQDRKGDGCQDGPHEGNLAACNVFGK